MNAQDDTSTVVLANAERVASKVWPEATVELEPLEGGLTNHNFKARVRDASEEAFVIRILGRGAEAVGVNRETEMVATKNAAALDVGPKWIASLPELDGVVMEFLPGDPVTEDALNSEEMLSRVAVVLRTLHEGPELPTNLDPFEMVERYRSIAVANEVELPADFEWARALAARLKSATGFSITAPCHCDLLCANLIDGETLRIVDWEYAGMSDPRCDLADLCAFNGLSADARAILLSKYYGSPDQRTLLSVNVLQCISYLRAGMWAVAQEGISELDLDYHGWGEEQFEKLRAFGRDEQFLADLAELERGHLE
jgi:thiamine kinase-like enzyme